MYLIITQNLMMCNDLSHYTREKITEKILAVIHIKDNSINMIAYTLSEQITTLSQFYVHVGHLSETYFLLLYNKFLHSFNKTNVTICPKPSWHLKELQLQVRLSL
jgi:hypothetical protein